MADENQPGPRFEDALGEAFSRAGDGFQPTAGPRLHEVTARGRTLRRRRTAAFAGSVTAVALLGVAGAFAAGFGAAPARSGSPLDAAAAPTSAMASSPTRSTTAQPTHSNPDAIPPRPEAQPDGDEVLAVAAALLPAGFTQADAGSSKGFASFNVDDGNGKGEVEIWVAKQPAGAPDPRYDNSTALPDGSKLVVQPDASAAAGATTVWSADILHPDGTRVVVRAFNTAIDKNTGNAKAGRSTPSLTLDQLKAIATNPIWLQHNGKK
ncbi:hypothetical protein [Kitasatospora aburaviensis]|uniref:Uncharacterized protein n=1 Tax=Kitasatospora aburaviensis TaxID=67265 RepID=A0ABW1F7I7_9ACTN